MTSQYIQRPAPAALLAVLGLMLSPGSGEVGLYSTSMSDASLIVVPNETAAVEGNANNVSPFAVAPESSSMRYQQVFSSSEFGAVADPMLITHLRFRPDAEFGAPFPIDLPAIQVNLSTTSSRPDGLSTTFADNVGADDTIVFSGGLTLTTSLGGPAAGPRGFDYVIALQVPFLYDPSGGNLLLDVRNFSSPFASGALDAQVANHDGTSRVFSDSFAGQGVTSPVGLADSLGLIVQFQFTATSPVSPCATADPFVVLGGGTCVNGGWLPPGFAPAGSAPSSTPTDECASPDPFAVLGGGTCSHGGWLPPALSSPSAPGCVMPDPFATLGGGTCANGGWLPPDFTPPAAPTPGGCQTPDPFTTIGGGGCLDGGWVPLMGLTCVTAVSPMSQSVSADSVTGSVEVSAPSWCPWSPISDSPFVTVIPGTRSGTDSFSYTVAANSGASSRRATITIGGETFVVTQAASTYPTPPIVDGATLAKR